MNISKEQLKTIIKQCTCIENPIKLKLPNNRCLCIDYLEHNCDCDCDDDECDQNNLVEIYIEKKNNRRISEKFIKDENRTPLPQGGGTHCGADGSIMIEKVQYMINTINKCIKCGEYDFMISDGKCVDCLSYDINNFEKKECNICSTDVYIKDFISMTCCDNKQEMCKRCIDKISTYSSFKCPFCKTFISYVGGEIIVDND